MAKSTIIPSSLALVASMLTSGLAQAQTQAALPADTATESEELVVTGSYIRGASESAALPVDVITTELLSQQGMPSNVDLIKSLPFIGATFAGDANPLGASRVQGASSVNLRGLGNARTLVLLNGRRLAPITSGTQTLIDTNSLPMGAVQRIEVLQGGGASIYGSDAIAGVVNFITAERFEGLDITGSYSFLDGSDGDLSTTARWGFGSEATNVVLSLGYQHRSQLPVMERDWAFRPYLENPTGWVTSGNPGVYSVGNSIPTSVSFVDPACEAAGNELTPLPVVGAARQCLMHYIGFENLVDEQEAFQTYIQINSEINPHTRFYLDAFYSEINVDEVATVGSSAVLNPPSTASTGGPGPGIIPGRFFIPATNPGLIDLLATYDAAALGLSPLQYTNAQTIGVNALANWRPIGIGGNPAFGGGSKLDHRHFTFYRLSGGFAGDNVLGFDIDWDVNGTFSHASSDASAADLLVSRFQYALRGLGGPNCTPGGADPATSTPGAGPCQYFNPFSTGLERNALTGEPNSGFVGNANSADLVRWFTNPGGSINTNQIMTFDALFSGEFPGMSLPGGPIGWATGAQYRWARVVVESNDLSNFLINPCVDEGAPASSCPTSLRGLSGIFGPVVPRDYDQEVRGVFAELSLPITEALQAQLAVRHETHDAGETTNPNIALRWQILENFALRASAQGTYRAPPLAFVDPNISQTITVAIGSVRVPFDSRGNPDLRPETSTNYNLGAIFSLGGLSGTLDYWRFEIEDQIILEDGAALVNALFPAVGPNNCGNPAYAELQARFTFQAGGCTNVASIARVQRYYTNGAPIEASGVDLSLQYDFGEVFDGDLTLELDLTQNLEFLIGPTDQFGIRLSNAFDAVGLLNVGIDPRALPEWRAQFAANYELGPHNFRWLSRYVDSMHDQRAGTGGVNDPLRQQPGFPVPTIVEGGVNIDSYLVHDFYYRFDLGEDTTFNLSVINMFDEDPPLTRNELSYDAFTASPLGRVIKLGVRRRF